MKGYLYIHYHKTGYVLSIKLYDIYNNYYYLFFHMTQYKHSFFVYSISFPHQQNEMKL